VLVEDETVVENEFKLVGLHSLVCFFFWIQTEVAFLYHEIFCFNLGKQKVKYINCRGNTIQCHLLYKILIGRVISVALSEKNCSFLSVAWANI
jgi:hypothetical protein